MYSFALCDYKIRFEKKNKEIKEKKNEETESSFTLCISLA